MSATSSRALVSAFYDALITRDAQRIVSFVADDVDWLMYGPVDLFPFCGQHRGKAAVFDVFARQIPAILQVTGYVQDYLLVDGDRAASFNRVTATERTTGRVIACRIAQFLRLQGDKIVEFRSLVDTLDLVEQMLGRTLDLDNALRPPRVAAAAGDAALLAV